MLYDKLKNYSQDGVYPFHMPGHKRNLDSSVLPYDIDLTEIYDFDNLHGACGCIKKVADKAAKLYGADFAYLLVNGATGGVLSAIRAMTDYGGKIIIARNCHKSVYNACELCGLDVQYILPKINTEYGVFSSVTPEQVERALTCNPDAGLVVITSPTYEGVTSDIGAIADICHKHGARLFVDEAHGAHFVFSCRFPCEAVNCGADAAVVSLHKTLPSLTQTALLLTNQERLALKLEENLSFFETSSPSYVLMSSIEKCLEYAEKKEVFNFYLELLDEFYNKCSSFKALKLLYNDFKELKTDFFDLDISKIVVSTADVKLNGAELAQILREKYKIEVEMAYTDYIIAMTSVCDNRFGFDRLYSALSEIDKSVKIKSSPGKHRAYMALPKKAFKACQKHMYSNEFVDIKSAENRTSAEYLWAYPPGIPIIVPGEIIDNGTISAIDKLIQNGVDVYSANRRFPKQISVVKH